MSADKKPRLLHDQRDMLLSLAPLVAACLLVAGLAGKCSFSFAGLAGPGQAASAVRDVDAASALRESARFLPFPVRVPVVAPPWRSIAVDQESIKSAVLPVQQISVNYLSPAGRAYRFTQTDARPADLAAWLGVGGGTDQGDHVIGDIHWKASAQGETTAWIWDAGVVRVSLTATGGNEADFRTLAEAVRSAPVAQK